MPDTPEPPKNESKDRLDAFPHDGREDPATVLARNMHSRYENEGPLALVKMLKEVKPDEKKLLPNVVQKIVAKTKEKPLSFREHEEWLGAAGALSVLAPDVHASMSKEILEKTRAAIAILESGQDPKGRPKEKSRFNFDLPSKEKGKDDPNDPIIQQHDRMVKLHKLTCLASTDDMRRTCIETFTAWEKALQRDNAKDIGPFVKRQIENAQKKEKDWLRPIMKEAMKRTFDDAEFRKKYPNLVGKLQEKDGEYLYTTENEGKKTTWKVDIYSEGAPLLSFRTTDPKKAGLMCVLDIIEGPEALEKELGLIDKKAAVAEREFNQEGSAEQQKLLNEYDLPKDKKISYIRLFPASDRSMQTGLHTTSLMAATLKARYPDVDVRPPLYDDEPANALRKDLEAAVKENGGKPLHVSLEIYSHGMQDHFVFPNKMRAADIVQIAKDFPQCTFTVNTIACYGAGMIDGLSQDSAFTKDKDLQKRIVVFTQTKGDIPNPFAFAKTTTMYQMHFIRALQEGETYGEAHRLADIEIKKYIAADAEGIINGQRLTLDKPMGGVDGMT